MKLKTISFSNLKGRTETVELGDANLIFGQNFSHKTTILDAIKLALLGFHPSLDKTPRGVFELSSGEELSVSAVISHDYNPPADLEAPQLKKDITQHVMAMGTTSPAQASRIAKYSIAHESVIGRTWTRHGQSVTKKDFVPMGFPETPIVLLDANDYFGRSDRGKVEMMFAAGKIEARMPQASADISATLISLDDPVAHIGWSQQQKIEFLQEAVEKRRSETAASVKRMAGTLQGVSELQLKEATTPLPEGLLAELKKQQGELEELQRQLREATTAKTRNDITQTPEETEISAAHKEAATLVKALADLKAKRSVVESKWITLLGNSSCPTCGTKGAEWKKNAAELQGVEMGEIAESICVVSERQLKLSKLIQAKEPETIKKRKRQIKSDTDKIDGIEEAIAGARQDIDKLEKQQQAVMNEAADRKRLAQAKEEHDKYLAQEKQLNAAKKYLLETKAKMVEEMFEPILKVAKVFTKGILRGELWFHNSELGMLIGEDVEIPKYGAPLGDWNVKSAWIPHRTFCGCEQSLAFTGLQVALAANAPIKLLIMDMDKLREVDEENTELLFAKINAALKEGIIHQFIGVMTKLPAFKLDGFTLIERKR